ncbi:Protoporphyrinogen oxidase [Patellaria atrata CBS 101060]|uniref:Protoporphyrinogen oxidase n=1 Tax=Patellaria atrata CBS 101060 TaxID=1346257 RepID=A0A9P4VPK7_9PEZI|nr:Protoporphyrinogen oxidase [Patellaria atrata CBS 101060]
MRLHKHVFNPERLICNVHLRTRPIDPRFTRLFSTAATAQDNSLEDVAIIGGGLTGLASAYYLAKERPSTKITIYEASSRTGGWLNSKYIDTPYKKQVLFETGPHSIRSGGEAAIFILFLIQELDLQDEILPVSRFSLSARNRFIYYPDRLVKMPQGVDFQSLYSFVSEPVFREALPGLVREPWIDALEDPPIDESVGDFISRRLGRPIAENLVSAIIHGIYAGNIWELSSKMLMPVQRKMEEDHGSILLGYISGLYKKPELTIPWRDFETFGSVRESGMVLSEDIKDKLSGASIYTFNKGLQQLTDRLTWKLELMSNITIERDTEVENLQLDSRTGNVNLKIKTNKSRNTISKSHVISTIFSKHTGIQALADTDAVTVMVVNLYYSNQFLLPVNGFGYLLPMSLPFSQNPEFALGVSFDSDCAHLPNDPAGTKVSVMLGGHWWDNMTSYPDEKEGLQMARSVLERHLGIKDEPVASLVSLQKDCIPQYKVGHEEKMRKAHAELNEKYRGRVRVTGNSYHGVSVNDCARGAWDVVRALVRDSGPGLTGLEHFRNPHWIILRSKR